MMYMYNHKFFYDAHSSVCVCMYLCAYVCIYVYMYVSNCIAMYVLYVYVCIYVHSYVCTMCICVYSCGLLNSWIIYVYSSSGSGLTCASIDISGYLVKELPRPSKLLTACPSSTALSPPSNAGISTAAPLKLSDPGNVFASACIVLRYYTSVLLLY